VALILPPPAAEQLAAMPRANGRRLRDRLARIAEAPYGPQTGVKPLTGSLGEYRVRQGDWRAIYVIKDGNVIVGTIGNRKEVYR
jgi:mRNA interferase RelE/StbE